MLRRMILFAAATCAAAGTASAQNDYEGLLKELEARRGTVLAPGDSLYETLDRGGYIPPNRPPSLPVDGRLLSQVRNIIHILTHSSRLDPQNHEDLRNALSLIEKGPKAATWNGPVIADAIRRGEIPVYHVSAPICGGAGVACAIRNRIYISGWGQVRRLATAVVHEGTHALDRSAYGIQWEVSAHRNETRFRNTIGMTTYPGLENIDGMTDVQIAHALARGGSTYGDLLRSSIDRGVFPPSLLKPPPSIRGTLFDYTAGWMMAQIVSRGESPALPSPEELRDTLVFGSLATLTDRAVSLIPLPGPYGVVARLTAPIIVGDGGATLASGGSGREMSITIGSNAVSTLLVLATLGTGPVGWGMNLLRIGATILLGEAFSALARSLFPEPTPQPSKQPARHGISDTLDAMSEP